MCAIPDPCFGINRFADRSQEAKTREIVSLWVLFSPFHERSDRSRSGIENRDAILLNDSPPPISPPSIRRPLVHHTRHAVREGPIDNVTVTRDPPNVCSRPTHICFGLYVKDQSMSCRGVRQIATGRVKNSFRACRRTRGVHDVERVFSRKRLW